MHLSRGLDIINKALHIRKYISKLNAQVTELEYAKNFYYSENYNNNLKFAIARSIMLSSDYKGLAYHLLENFDKSSSQLLQDLIADYLFQDSKLPFFVEFGAADGMTFSNTYFLEKNRSWNGIVAEPSHGWMEKLKANRGCKIDFRCVYSQSGQQVIFNESKDLMLSGVKQAEEVPTQSDSTRCVDTYLVETVSLDDLLVENSAPNYIHFASIDTEGSEFEILSSFDFTKHKFGCLVIEHNFTDSREKIKNLMIKQGYMPFLENLTLWDDWYLSPEIFNKNFQMPLASAELRD